jgi:NF-kappa-B inhibitor-interacting Ras-like protein
MSFVVVFQPFPSTLEDIYAVNVDTDRGIKETLRIYDTEGLDPKSTTLKVDLAKHLVPFADGYILVYSIEDEASFQVVDVIRKEVEKHREAKRDLVIVVLGNKTDVSAQRRQVETVQALNWAAREKVKVFEVSAHDRKSLYEPFVYLSSKLNPPHTKSSFSQLTMGRTKQPKSSES